MVNSCCDLGVTISSDLSSSLYINDIVSRAHQQANLIPKCFVSQNVNLLVRAFVTYVRPLLEYNSYAWSPSHKRDITFYTRQHNTEYISSEQSKKYGNT